MTQDLRVPMDPILAAFGVPATVTRPAPDDAPLDATVVWLSPEAAGVPDGDPAFSRVDPKRFAAVSYAEVATIPRLTQVEAPETLDGPVLLWRVDGTVRVEPDFAVVVLLPLERYD
ncbi:MAG: hypothetical protein AB7O32_00490 [Vicinamibacterales bacterium]